MLRSVVSPGLVVAKKLILCGMHIIRCFEDDELTTGDHAGPSCVVPVVVLYQLFLVVFNVS